MTRFAIALATTAMLALSPPVGAAEADGMFWVRDAGKTPDLVVASIKSYAESRQWLYLADFKLKGGEVTAVKICYPPIGKDVVAAGMHVFAMMPCGHIAVYVEGGRTRLSMLHPKFMTALYPSVDLERAVATVTPLFEAMLLEVTR